MKPNFLVIIADQMRADCTSYQGHPDIVTPNLHALSQRARVYTNHIAAAPICLPSRMALITGRNPRSNGSVNNLVGAGGHETSYVQILAEAGYDCVSFGSNHINPEPFGFDYFAAANTHRTPSYREHLARLDLGVDPTAFSPPNGLPHDHKIPYGLLPVDMKHHYDAFVTDKAIEYMARLGGRPFYQQVCYHLPHYPFVCDRSYFDLYDRRSIRIADFAAKIARHPELQGVYEHLGCDRLTEEEVRDITACYYGAISFIDAQVGRLLEALKRRGLDQNTHVLFTSDHGEFCGDLGLFTKAEVPVKPLVHVPFLWAQPEGVHEMVPGFTEHIDVAPAILGTAGLECPYLFEGQNLLERQRDWTYSEIAKVTHDPEDGKYRKSRYYASYLDPEWQYVHSSDAQYSALYHLRDDPREHVNVIERYPGKANELRHKLLDRVLLTTHAHQGTTYRTWQDFHERKTPVMNSLAP